MHYSISFLTALCFTLDCFFANLPQNTDGLNSHTIVLYRGDISPYPEGKWGELTENQKAEYKRILLRNKKVYTETMFTMLSKDGFITSQKPYNIVINKNELIVNGKTQTQSLHKKYVNFIQKTEELPLAKLGLQLRFVNE